MSDNSLMNRLFDAVDTTLSADARIKEIEFEKIIGLKELPFDRSNNITCLMNDYVNAVKLDGFKLGYNVATTLLKESKIE